MKHFACILQHHRAWWERRLLEEKFSTMSLCQKRWDKNPSPEPFLNVKRLILSIDRCFDAMLYNSSQPQRFPKSRQLPAREMVEYEQRHEAQLHAFLSRLSCMLRDQSGMDGIESYYCSVGKELLSPIGAKHDGREYVNDWSFFGCPNSWQVWSSLHKDQLSFTREMFYTSTRIIGRHALPPLRNWFFRPYVCTHDVLLFLPSSWKKNNYLHDYEIIKQSSFQWAVGLSAPCWGPNVVSNSMYFL